MKLEPGGNNWIPAFAGMVLSYMKENIFPSLRFFPFDFPRLWFDKLTTSARDRSLEGFGALQSDKGKKR
jgi:hypothetical protein